MKWSFDSAHNGFHRTAGAGADMTANMSADHVHVACVSNAGFVPHFATMLNSLAASNPPEKVTVHLLHDDSVTPDMQDRLRELAHRQGLSLGFLQPTDTLLAQLPPRSSHYPSIVWYRILLPELLSHVDRVLYIDADTLVMQDLRSVWSMDLGDALLAAVAQPKAWSQTPAHRARIQLSPDAHYLNSGVILMNLRQMRKEGATAKILAVGHSHAAQLSDATEFSFMDQDALNSACADRWLRLHPKWNSLASIYLAGNVEEFLDGEHQFAEAAASPGIVHFEGSVFAKPWNYRCLHPLQHLYLAYRRDTPWPLEQLEDAGLTSKLLRPLPPRLQLWLAEMKHRVLRMLRQK